MHIVWLQKPGYPRLSDFQYLESAQSHLDEKRAFSDKDIPIDQIFNGTAKMC